jgi:hypothetical protein
MENKYFDTEYNVETGEYKQTPWTQEMIDAHEAALVADQSAKPTVEQLQAQLADIASQLQALQGVK